MKKMNVAILGVTGAVGQELLKLLDERDFPIDELRPLASKRSAGSKIVFRGKEITIQEATENSFEGIDLVLSSAGGSISKALVPAAVKAGAVVVDNTSAFRMDPSVPLVVPEVNPEDIEKNQGIIANPNCTTIIMLVALNPIYRSNRIKRIVVSTYQSASGAGAQAMEELKSQSRDLLDGKDVTPKVFPYQIAFNLFSHNTAIDASGYCEEERKMIKETRKILHDDTIEVVPTCVRVPILRAHSEAILVEFENEISEDEARSLFASAPGLKVVDNREKNYFPMPLDVNDQDDVFVGRIRRPGNSAKELALFVCGDQIRKGAALNAVQIAEIWAKSHQPT